MIRDYLNNSFIRLIALIPPIAYAAQEIRQNHWDKIDFEDGIHVSTAIEFNCEWFITYDGDRPKNRKKDRKLLLPLDKQFKTKNGKPLRILTPGDFLKEIFPMPLIDEAKLSNKG